MSSKLSPALIAALAIALTLAIAQPGLAGPLFSSPIPPPDGGEAVWCADIETSFTPGPGAGEMSFVATLTNTTYVTTPLAYPLNMPDGRVQVGVWQQQRRRQTDTGYLFEVPATKFLATSIISGTFGAPVAGSPVRYYLKLWDETDGVWGRTGCEMPPEVVYPPASQPPPPQPETPANGSWRTNYDPVPFGWQPAVVTDSVPAVLDYELRTVWGDGTIQTVTTTLTATTVALPAAVDQPVVWQLRSRNSAGYGRWSEPVWDFGIDTTPPDLTPIVQTQGVLSGTWQNMVATPVFTWSGSDAPFGSGLAGYMVGWTQALPCTPETFTTTTVFSTTATGINYLCVQARDGAGNLSPMQSFEFRYDPPGVSVELTPTLAAVYPGEQVGVTLTMTNESLAADVFTQTSGSGPWTLSGVPAVLNMAGSEVQSRALTLDIPVSAADSEVYIVPITAMGQTGNYAMDSIVAAVSRPDALVVQSAPDLVGRPGEVLTYSLAVTNGAVVPVTFDLSAVSAWPVTLPVSLTVAGLDMAEFEVSLPVPASAGHGENNDVVITATNRAYPAFSMQVTITGTASRAGDSLTASPPLQTALPAAIASYTLTLSSGSGASEIFDLTTEATWPVTLLGSVTAPGGAAVNVPVSVLVPGGVLSGTVHSATLKAVSRANPAVQMSSVITTVVGPRSRLQTTLLPPARVLRAAAGEVITTTATLWYQNDSNYVDDLAAAANLPPGWPGGLSTPTAFSLDPLAGRLGTLEVSVPATAASGAYQIPVTVQGTYDQVITTLDLVLVRQEAVGRSGGVYLPLILKGDTPSTADLIGSFTFVNGSPVVIVENIGQAAAGEFWVDFYVDPAPTPSGANQPWDYLCSVSPSQCQGIAWYVSSEVAPGGSMTLRLADAYPPNTRWSGVFGTHEFYLYVDSWNPGVSSGAVAEGDEGNNLSHQTLLINSGNLASQQQAEFEPVAGRVRRGE